MAERAQRYTAVAIVLHWSIAAAILFMLPLGFWMHERAEDGLITDGVFRAFQLHKSIGLTILGLSLVRLGWRLINPPPPFPPHMPRWERVVAKATHWAFYVLMIAMPLSGWLYVSSGWSIHDEQALVVTTRWFDLVRVPALFDLPTAGEEVREATAEAAFAAHALMAWSMIALAGLHVAAALKHHLFDKDSVLANMTPGVRAPFEPEPAPKSPGRLAVLGVGLGLAGAAMAAALAVASTFGGEPDESLQNQSAIELPAPDAAAPAAGMLETATAADPEAPPLWRVDTAQSSIAFSFVYSDAESGETTFEGRFNRWRADIRFDPEALEASSAAVTIETASATDGVAIHDSTLQTAAWFNAAAHPTAAFVSREIRRVGDGYEARGELTIKGRTRDVELPFTLVIDGDRAVMQGSLRLDRHDFDIGEDTEADDFISREVAIGVRVVAVRLP